MSVLIFLIISYILLSVGLYKIFEKAGEDGWKGLVPGLNFIVWCKLIGRPAWWAALLLIPLVNFFIFAGMCIDMVRSFGHLGFRQAVLAVVGTPFYFLYLGFKEDKYVGPILTLEKEYAAKLVAAEEKKDAYEYKKLQANNPYTKSGGREWAEAVIFAVFAAALIRMFLVEAYVIPTSSMEGSLLVGDFLFVSKAHYGMRTPMTLAMVPLLHNRLPIVNRESYLKTPSLDYHRFPAIENIKRNYPIVFNYPEGDSVYVIPGRTYSVSDVRRGSIDPRLAAQIRQKRFPLTVRPIDKKDHYIKRCIGIPGDSLQIIDRQVHINGKPAENPTNLQFSYRVSSGSTINTDRLDEWGVSLRDHYGASQGFFNLNKEQVEKIKGMGSDVKVEAHSPKPNNAFQLFPHDPKNFKGWTVDNFGPVYIPKQGATVDISTSNIALYRRVISIYEGNKLEVKGNKIFINGQEATTYTFKQDYYWAMGDNRHNSEDSRVWGFVPADHIVGKPLFIWFSTKHGSIGNGINFSRIFTGATKM